MSDKSKLVQEHLDSQNARVAIERQLAEYRVLASKQEAHVIELTLELSRTHIDPNPNSKMLEETNQKLLAEIRSIKDNENRLIYQLKKTADTAKFESEEMKSVLREVNRKRDELNNQVNFGFPIYFKNFFYILSSILFKLKSCLSQIESLKSDKLKLISEIKRHGKDESFLETGKINQN